MSNRQEKEKFVAELYREGKNYRQISKIAVTTWTWVDVYPLTDINKKNSSIEFSD